ncbi:hypothetical protein [Sinorhizobium alkalisoli]|uniref:Uncharacterized protein n=1 Tax=Sinorhizobium alkalisoli TaxID=1752398 RepID=A0A1E3V802_9HYPH|nr:hypothetical protein [Sinorhizobium alkalisoli]MCG5481234.1 hypothetical protein [Sinorhizobium alkalisoli]ODR89577.1 hypothetical protein A8M32_19875 [Sinorhizobium alkalisoli]
MHKDDPLIKQKLAQIDNHRRHATFAEDRAYMLLEDAKYSYEHIARLKREILEIERRLITVR